MARVRGARRAGGPHRRGPGTARAVSHFTLTRRRARRSGVTACETARLTRSRCRYCLPRRPDGVSTIISDGLPDVHPWPARYRWTTVRALGGATVEDVMRRMIAVINNGATRACTAY